MERLIERASNLIITRDRNLAKQEILETFRKAKEEYGRVGFISGVVSSGGIINTLPNLIRLERYSRAIKKRTKAQGFPSYSALDFFDKEALLRIFGKEQTESGGHEQQKVMQEVLLSGNVTDFFTIQGWTEYPEIAIDEYGNIAMPMKAEGRMTITHAHFGNRQLPSTSS